MGSCSGWHYRKGETYESNIIKEVEEEIGIKNIHFNKSFFEKHEGTHKHFTQWFELTIDKEISDFIIQESEVEKIKWYKKGELLNLLNKKPDKFLKSIKNCLNKFNN